MGQVGVSQVKGRKSISQAGRFCKNTRCLGDSESFAKASACGHGKNKAGKACWDKLRMGFEYHPKKLNFFMKVRKRL